jgi:hypothetical protein
MARQSIPARTFAGMQTFHDIPDEAADGTLSNRCTLSTHQPRNERNDRTQDQHRRDRKHEPESWPVNDNVARQMKQIHSLEPRPEQPGDYQHGPECHEDTIHLPVLF